MKWGDFFGQYGHCAGCSRNGLGDITAMANRIFFVTHNFCVGKSVCWNSKSFQGFYCFCLWLQLVSPFKKRRKKAVVSSSLPKPLQGCYSCRLFFALWEGVHLSLHSPSLVWALAHSGSVAANNNTALPIFLPARLPCGYWNRVGTPCVAARFFQEHLRADCTARLRFRAESLRSALTVGASRQAECAVSLSFDCSMRSSKSEVSQFSGDVG